VRRREQALTTEGVARRTGSSRFHTPGRRREAGGVYDSVMERKRPVWIWILGGCLLLVILGGVFVAGAVYWGGSKLMSMAEEQQDPETRAEKVREMLGASSLPPGYHAGFSVSLGVVRTARLADDPDDEQATRRFVFNDSMRSSDSKLDDYLAGTRGNVFEEMGTRIRSDEQLRDGEMEVNGQKVRYTIRRGEFTHSEVATPGLMTVMRIGCDDDRERWAVWAQRESPATPTPQIELDGSVADETAIRAFLSHFNVCRRR
jgi:hypothetical protein